MHNRNFWNKDKSYLFLNFWWRVKDTVTINVNWIKKSIKSGNRCFKFSFQSLPVKDILPKIAFNWFNDFNIIIYIEIMK